MEEKTASRLIRNYGKNIIIFFLIIVIGNTLIYLTYKNFKQELIEGLNARQMIHAKQAARAIETFFGDHIIIMQNYAKNDHIVNLDESGKRLMREFLSSHGGEISIITRIDSEGRILYPEPYDRNVIGQPVTKMEDFLKVKLTRQIAVSDVFKNRRGFQSVIVHVPVLKHGSFDGTLAILVSFDFIAKRYIEDIRIGKDGYAWMISRNGIEISCPVPGHVGNSVFDNCREFPDILAMAKRMIQGEQGVTTYMFDRIREGVVSKTVKHALFMPIKVGNNFWSIVVATPEDELLSSMKSFRNRIIVIIFIFITGMGFFFYLLFRTNILVKEVDRRRKVEEALRESEKHLKEAQRVGHIGSWDLNVKTGDLHWSDECYRIYGFRPQEFVPTYEKFRSIVHPEDLKVVQEQADSALNNDKHYDVDFRVVRSNGEIGWIHCEGEVMRDAEGEPLRFFGTQIDITERKRAQDELIEQLKFLQVLIDTIPIPVFFKDCNGIYLGCNKACEFFFGPRDQLLGKTVYDVSPKDIADIYNRADLELFNNPGIHVYESVAVDSAGGKHNIIINKATYKDKDGNVAGLIGTIFDITERRQMEVEHRELEERLYRAEKMESLGLLAGGVAHDLNNVLGIVVGYTEMLMDEMDESNPMREDLKKILEGGNRSAAIVQDLLTLARRGVQNKKVVNLNATIMDCQKLPEFEKVFSHNPQVKLKTDLESDLLNIMGSPVHLGKTIINLASNAVEAMPNGGVLKIATTNQYLDMPIHGYDNIREGDYVVLTVSDTGEGILERDIKRIFEPFYTKKIMGRSGTGLGLAVVWGTIKDHNGYINVESTEEKGTTFTLYFPVTREDIASDQISISMSEYMGRGETILVVDDIGRQRELATRMLTKLNYSVNTVAGGEEAIEYLKKNKADLIVLDMIMDPGIDGLETYEKILEVSPMQKAIIVSGFSESDRVKEAQRIGAGAYVPKPYVLERLGMAVRKALDRT